MNQHDKPKPVFRLHVQEKHACCGSDHRHEHDHAQANEASHDGRHHHDHVGACCTPGTQASIGASFAKQTPPPENASRVRYRIDKMDCPTEEGLIRNK